MVLALQGVVEKRQETAEIDSGNGKAAQYDNCRVDRVVFDDFN